MTKITEKQIEAKALPIYEEWLNGKVNGMGVIYQSIRAGIKMEKDRKKVKKWRLKSFSKILSIQDCSPIATIYHIQIVNSFTMSIG